MEESRFIPTLEAQGENVYPNQSLPLWKRHLWWWVRKRLPSLRASLAGLWRWACWGCGEQALVSLQGWQCPYSPIPLPPSLGGSLHQRGQETKGGSGALG